MRTTYPQINIAVKYLFILRLLFMFSLGVLIPSFAFANTDDGVWSYVFHLEYTEGQLAVEKGVKFSYRPIPVAYVSHIAPSSTDYYGIVIGVRGKEEARFGFNRPTTQVVSTGKGLLSVKAPYFADADHVSFYSKDQKKLFDISVKKSSFCNNDNKCNASVGENHTNCPSDCAEEATSALIEPLPMPLDLVATNTPSTDTTVAPTGDEPAPVEAAPSESTVIKSAGNMVQFTKSPLIIAILIGSIVLLLILLLFWRIKKNMD